jgi:hypothetical protein
MIKLRYAHKFKVLVLFLSIVSVPVFAQNSSKLSKKKGISYVSPDSLFSVTFRFRMQNRAKHEYRVDI